jgi:hypothetical protein
MKTDIQGTYSQNQLCFQANQAPGARVMFHRIIIHGVLSQNLIGLECMRAARRFTHTLTGLQTSIA